MLQCPVPGCPRRFHTNRQLLVHIHRHHAFKSILGLAVTSNVCFVCESVFESRNSVYKHLVSSFETGICVTSRSTTFRA